MEIEFGTNKFDSGQAVRWEAEDVINGHMMIVGSSGTGKTHNIKNALRSMVETSYNPLKIHVFDVHDDIRFDSGSSDVMFSETTGYGFNPFIIDPDPHTGGVRKCVNNFIDVLNKTSSKLGPNQQTVLRNILYDLFEANGFYLDNPDTWVLDDGRPRKYPKKYPTLLDAFRFASGKLRRLYTGADTKAGKNLEQLNKAVNKMRRNVAQGSESDVARSKKQCKDAYCDYIDSIDTGKELDDVIRYGKRDELAGIVNRLDTLKSIGIFKNETPPFDDSMPIWRYRIKSLNFDERKVFVLFKLWDIFRNAVAQGEKDYIDQVVVLDEAHIYMDEDEQNITNILGKEARKFGVAMVLASQSTKHYPPDVIKNCATKIVLGLDESDWRRVMADFNIEKKELEWVNPKKTVLIQVKKSGGGKNRFVATNLH